MGYISTPPIVNQFLVAVVVMLVGAPAAAQMQPAPWGSQPGSTGGTAAPLDQEAPGYVPRMTSVNSPEVRATTDYLSPRQGAVLVRFESPARVQTVAVALDDPNPQRPVAPDRRDRRDLCQTPCELYLDPGTQFELLVHAPGVQGWFTHILVPQEGGLVRLRVTSAAYSVGGVAFLAGFFGILVGLTVWAAPQQWWGRGLNVQTYTEAGITVVLSAVAVLGAGIVAMVAGRGGAVLTPRGAVSAAHRFSFVAGVVPLEGGAMTAAILSF